MQDKYIKKHPLIIPYDFFGNLIIRIPLAKRGAKQIYSSREKSIEVLGRLTPEIQDGYVVPDESAFRCNVQKNDLGGFPLYILTSKSKTQTKKKVIYLHGGAFVNQPEKYHFSATGKIAEKSGATVYFFVYPKAPSHTFELTYRLVEDLYGKLLEDTSADDIIFMGDSAGAMMCMCLCRLLESKNLPLPDKLILYSPVANTALDNPDIKKFYPKDPMQGVDGLKYYIETWAGNEDINSPLINPASLDLSKLPPVFIFCGNREIFNPDVILLADKIHDSGSFVELNIYRGMYHCFTLFYLLSSGLARLKTIKIIKE